jgi:hypothetical protein
VDLNVDVICETLRGAPRTPNYLIFMWYLLCCGRLFYLSLTPGIICSLSLCGAAAFNLTLIAGDPGVRVVSLLSKAIAKVLILLGRIYLSLSAARQGCSKARLHPKAHNLHRALGDA